MRSSDRRRALLDRLRSDGHADTAALAQDFSVDGSTIRRDLARLSQAGLVRRTRGGVLLAEPSEVVDIPHDMRRAERQGAKRAIARAAAALVGDGETVILDNGSTTLQIAIELRSRRNLTVVTSDLLIGLQVARHLGQHLHITGGALLSSFYSLVGPHAVAAFDGLHADWLFMGAEGIHPEAGVTNINLAEIAIKRAMIAAAQNVVFAADSTKFGRRAFATVCRISDATLLLTDDELAMEQRAAYGERLRCVGPLPPARRRPC